MRCGRLRGTRPRARLDREKGGDKAKWILDACRQLPKYARVKKAFWFHINDGRVDWRLTTSLASLQAFRRCAPGTALK